MGASGPPHSGPRPPSGPLIGAPAGHGQLFVGGQGIAGQEELWVDGAAAGLDYLGPAPAGGPAARGAALVQGEELVKHVSDEQQPLVQLCHLWGQEQSESGSGGGKEVTGSATHVGPAAKAQGCCKEQCGVGGKATKMALQGALCGRRQRRQSGLWPSVCLDAHTCVMCIPQPPGPACVWTHLGPPAGPRTRWSGVLAGRMAPAKMLLAEVARVWLEAQ